MWEAWCQELKAPGHRPLFPGGGGGVEQSITHQYLMTRHFPQRKVPEGCPHSPQAGGGGAAFPAPPFGGGSEALKASLPTAAAAAASGVGEGSPAAASNVEGVPVPLRGGPPPPTPDTPPGMVGEWYGGLLWNHETTLGQAFG